MYYNQKSNSEPTLMTYSTQINQTTQIKTHKRLQMNSFLIWTRQNNVQIFYNIYNIFDCWHDFAKRAVLIHGSVISRYI